MERLRIWHQEILQNMFEDLLEITKDVLYTIYNMSV